jgi:uncharacterized membrane protein
MMTTTSRLSPLTWLPLVTFVVSAWVGAALFYRDLPNLVPTHWSATFKPNGFTAKPWGPFVLPLTMTIVWLARRVIRLLSLRRHRVERFPGAFDFRIMLTIGVIFVIWNLVLTQSVFWLRVAAVPASVAMIVTAAFVATLPIGFVRRLAPTQFLTEETDWLRARWFAVPALVIAGVIVLALVAFGS